MCECTVARETREAEKRSVKNIMDVLRNFHERREKTQGGEH